MEYQIGTSVFDDWEIVGRIGSGASSVVYEIRKKGQDVGFTSALKVMRIPQDSSVIESLHSEGMDDESITSYLSGIVDELIEEIRIMVSLKGSPYIVSCEDFKKVHDPRSGQWEVLIRMERLQPLSEYLPENDMTQADVHRLALHITRALMLLESQGIIHRDIKPENIFVTEYGDFKIGDFGIARVKERASGSLQKAGTENYMAPEVYRGESYNSTVDLYSLGLILYKLLNKNKLPFYPEDKTAFTAMEQQLALQSRMSGRKEMPQPALASAEFGRIILKMCAFRPENRYQDAGALLADLEALSPSGDLVLLRQKSGSVVSGSGKSSEGGNLTHVVFAGGSGDSRKSGAEGAVPESDDCPENSKLTQEAAQEDVDHSVIPQDGAENISVPGTSGEENRRPVSPRPGYTEPEKETKDNKPERFDKKKIIIAVTAAAIILALIIPRLLAQEFTLTVNGGSGSGSYTSGTSVTVSAGEEEGSLFAGWEAEGIDLSAEDLSAEKITFKMPRKAVVLTAVYEMVSYRVTVNGGSGSGEYYFGDEISIEADEPEEGYEFAGWEVNSGSPSITDKSLSRVTFIMEEENVELTASYQQIDYKLTVNDGNGGGSYHFGDKVSISADSEMNGMTFSYWSVDSGSLELSDLTVLNITFTMPAEDVILTAHYAIEKYTVKVTNGSGNGMYEVGETVTVSAESMNDQGYAFLSWTVTSGELDTSALDLTQTVLSFVMPQNDLTLQANYAEQQTETTLSSETYVLSVNGGSGSGTYAAGETVTVTHDTPETGMAFAYWFISGYPDSIDASSEVLEITMPENDVTIVAVFVQE